MTNDEMLHDFIKTLVAAAFKRLLGRICIVLLLTGLNLLALKISLILALSYAALTFFIGDTLLDSLRALGIPKQIKDSIKVLDIEDKE